MKQYFSLNKEIHPGRDGELLCDQDGVKPLSGARNVQTSAVLIRIWELMDLTGWLPSPSDWCKIDNISESMCLVLRHNDSLSDPRNIFRRWDAPGYTPAPGERQGPHQTLSQLTSYTWYPEVRGLVLQIWPGHRGVLNGLTSHYRHHFKRFN